MRKAIALSGICLAAVSQSGCGLPTTMAAASLAMSGFTLMDQGKVVSDVVLSAVLEQDCAMWRIIRDEPVCVDVLDEAGVVADAEPDTFVPAAELPQVAEIAAKVPKTSASN